MKQVPFLTPSLLLAAALTFGAAACGGSDKPAEKQESTWSADQAAPDPSAPAPTETPAPAATAGMITKDQIKLGAIDDALAGKGKSMYELKCQSCHSLGENRVVGPGWKGITQRREPAWIMNMIMHTEDMLDKDPEAQKMLEQCLVRMPNQNLSQDEARQVLEFMRTLDKKA